MLRRRQRLGIAGGQNDDAENGKNAANDNNNNNNNNNSEDTGNDDKAVENGEEENEVRCLLFGIGRMAAVAVVRNVPLDVGFSRCLYKLLVGEAIDFLDVSGRSINLRINESLNQLTNH